MTAPLRVYPLDPRELTEEQLAVVFAMTSRRPEPFDEIAEIVTTEKAADFHERWVLNYGHASVAEHAIIHIAVENVSRLACDTLEDNRLGSYTEKSSRYQVIDKGFYCIPQELDGRTELRNIYVETCDVLFTVYQRMVEGIIEYLRTVRVRGEGERGGAYNVRLRREATDSARFLLPAATLTNVGVTMNARSMEHAIRKLLSSHLAEERVLGEELKLKGRQITPTLIKYADPNEYMLSARKAMQALAVPYEGASTDNSVQANLVDFDENAEAKVTTALLYRYAHESYEAILDQVQRMSHDERMRVIDQALEGLGPHDVPLRELEMTDYTFDMIMDYGAYREYKRHRMQTYIPQPLTVQLGYLTPPIVHDAGLQGEFDEAMSRCAEGFLSVSDSLPLVAEYLVTHAHKRRFLAKLNLRECYHLFKLRAQPEAHFSLSDPEYGVIVQAMKKVSETHGSLFAHLKLRR